MSSKLAADAEIVLKRLADAATREVVYDVETSGLDWRFNFICGYVFTFGPDPRDTFYIPVRHDGGANLLDWTPPDQPMNGGMKRHPFEKSLLYAASRRDLRWIGHNVKFDLLMTGGPVTDVVIKGPLEDTMVNQPLINEFTPGFSLEACCKYFGITGKIEEPLYRHMAAKFGGEPTRKDQMKNFWQLAGDDQLALDYARQDGVATWNLCMRQRKEIEADNLTRVWEVERRVTRVLFRMERRGIRIDLERFGQVRKIVDDRIEQASSKLPKGMNVRGPKDLVQFFTDMGLKDKWPTTPPSAKFPHGQPSFKEEWLSTNEPGKRILAVRKYVHLRDSFLKPLHERHIWKGRVHATYNQLRNDEFGTITGRLSCNDPNLQQVHKRNKELGRLFRSIFIPDPGKLYAAVDYSQIEPTLLAYYSRSKVLLEGYRSVPPVDAHTSVARAAGIDRESGKRLNQAILTGAGERKVALMLDKPMDEARAIMSSYFEAMPEIKTLQKEAGARMRARGYVLSILGRKARLEDASQSYKALNRLLQCGNADILKLKMAEIDEECERRGDETNLINNIHDDLAYQFPADDREFYEWCLRHMEDFASEEAQIKLDVPLRVAAGEGKNWSEATYGVEPQGELKL